MKEGNQAIFTAAPTREQGPAGASWLSGQELTSGRKAEQCSRWARSSEASLTIGNPFKEHESHQAKLIMFKHSLFIRYDKSL